MDAARRCALPGCYVVIEPPADGGPQRKYCTPAHRAVARQLRREATNRSACAPPLILQELPEPPLAAPVDAGPVRRRRTFSDVAGRRARAMAVLGSAGLLVTGGTMAFSGSPTSDSTTAAPWLAPDPEAEQNWASEANVTLASLDRQLHEVDEVEQSWNALPPRERGEQTPPDVAALAKRKALLEQQRARLAEELSTYQSLRAAKQELTDTDRHVAGLDKALAQSQQDRRSGSPDEDTAQQLRERRSAGDRLRQEQRQKLETLAERVHDAMSTPLPSGDHATRSITSRVRDLVKNPAGRHAGPALDGPVLDGPATSPGHMSAPGSAPAHGPASTPGSVSAPGSASASHAATNPGGQSTRGPLSGLGGARVPDTPRPPRADLPVVPPRADLPARPRRPDILAAPATPGIAKPGTTDPGTAKPGTANPGNGGPGTELRDSITQPREGVGERAPGGPLGGLAEHRPSGPSAVASNPVSRVAPGQNRPGRTVDGTLRRTEGSVGSGLGADRPGSPSGLPRLAPRQSRSPSSQPNTSRDTPDLILDDSDSEPTESRHQSAADDVIDALPFGAGVKQMARSAVADEIKSRQRKGRLSGGQSSTSYSSTTTPHMSPKSSSNDSSRSLDGISDLSDDSGGSSTTRYRGSKKDSSFSLDDLSSLSESYSSKYSSSGTKSRSRSSTSRSGKSSSPDDLGSVMDSYESVFGGSGGKSSKSSGYSKSSGSSKSSDSDRYSDSDWMDAFSPSKSYSSSKSSKSSKSSSSDDGKKTSSSDDDGFERALKRYSSGGSGKKSDSGSSDHYRSSGKSSGGDSSGGKSSSSKSWGKSSGSHFASKMAKSFKF